jgi:carboxypeptidase Q
MTFRKLALGLSFIALTVFAQEKTDYNLIHMIREEAFEHSQVMDHLAYLTDRYGPRLTASPEFDEAAGWVVGRMKSWGLANVHTESWGPFGRSWSLKHFAVEMVEPRYSLLNAVPLAWSEPTGKPVTGEPVMAPFAATANNLGKTAEDFEKYKQEWHGKLRGRIVLLNRPRTNSGESETRPDLTRYTEAELANLARTPDATPKIDIRLEDVKIPDDPQDAQRYMASLPADIRTVLADRNRDAGELRDGFWVDEGAAAIFMEDNRSHDGDVFAEAAGTRKATDHLSVPKFRLTEEHYNRIARLLERKERVTLRIDLEAAVGDHLNANNIVAEIPGGAKKDEVVAIGAHFDSWHGGTGATDNGAGSAVMMEVMRVLSTLHVKMDRTVRIVLWSGEEQGLLGSKAYVKEHFGDPVKGVVTAEHANLAAYFNLDNGSGRIRGVYLQGNDAARPFFERALIGPFRDLGVTTISLRNTGGTDHLSFDDVGLPGFQFIQDPLDYSTVTHHSTMDTYDHLVPADLIQASAVIASVVATEANAPEMMPRKPLPVARKAGGGQ